MLTSLSANHHRLLLLSGALEVCLERAHPNSKSAKLAASATNLSIDAYLRSFSL